MAKVQRQVITGPTGAGKTHELVKRVASLLEKGINPNQIVVLCASPVARDSFCEQLHAETAGCGCNREASCVEVTTVLEYALKLLDCEEAKVFTGRSARLLAGFETNILLEDLKTSGVRPRRLKEMLRFFYKGWTELADEDPAWLYLDEEQKVYGLLASCLVAMDGMLESEVSNLAVRFIRAGQDFQAYYYRDYVIVDDYQLLSRASQILVDLIVQKELWVAGDTQSMTQEFESYPYAEGFEELLTQADTVEHLEREDKCTTEFRVLETPQDEAEFVVQYVEEALRSGIPAKSINIATPNRAWAAAYTRALQSAEIAVCQRFESYGLNGDARDLASCIPARILTLLQLAEHDDAAAWRCWCGYGDWLLNSPAFCALRRLGVTGSTFAAVLDSLTVKGTLQSNAVSERIDAFFKGDIAADESASMVRVCEAYAQGKAYVLKLGALKGDAFIQTASDLVQGIEHSKIPAVIEKLFKTESTSGQTPKSFLETAYRRLCGFEGFASAGAVRVGSLEDVWGTSPHYVIACGMVNGFIPKHVYFDEVMTSPEQRERMKVRETSRLKAALGCACTSVLLTAFTHIDAQKAESLDLKVDRYRMVDGVRTALVSPSEIAGNWDAE
ncbi:MAG: AAA family ATPase [Coriobacteriales bacterium]|nr:AAA family ATPase [Coriobacteriales bacterium]